MSEPKNHLVYCSFCGKPRDGVSLVIGPEISICDVCALSAVKCLVYMGRERMMAIAVGRPPQNNKSWSVYLDEETETETT